MPKLRSGFKLRGGLKFKVVKKPKPRSLKQRRQDAKSANFTRFC